MLTEDKIIEICHVVDDILKGIGHLEDSSRRVSDSEVITTAIISALYFGCHLDNGRGFMKMTKLVPAMLDKSRFNRRLHSVSELIFAMFWQLGHQLMLLIAHTAMVQSDSPRN